MPYEKLIKIKWWEIKPKKMVRAKAFVALGTERTVANLGFYWNLAVHINRDVTVIQLAVDNAE
jgi:hypothetical protein